MFSGVVLGSRKGVMDRFLSRTINKVDKKGRVSIPASFRPVLKGCTTLYTILSVDQPTVDAGGPELIEAQEERLAQIDRLSPDYDYFSLLIHGDSSPMSIDGEGRVILSDAIREHAGITDRVAFVGRGDFFQIWEPERYLLYREEARLRVAEMRKALVAGSQAVRGAGT